MRNLCMLRLQTEYSRIHHLVKQTSFFVRAIEESMIRHASALIDIILLCYVKC
jgi:hypothetical protein